MTEKGLELIKSFEGFRADAYWDSTGKVWTIGYGATFYMDGTKVSKGDRITKEEATRLLEKMVAERFEKYVDMYVTSSINPNQRDALTSFTYNCGPGNLKKSALLRKVNADPSDTSIRQEFAKWNKSGGQVLAGLTRRRKAEADLYFTPWKGVQETPVVETAVSEEKKNEPVTIEAKADIIEPETIEIVEHVENEVVVIEREPKHTPWYKRFWLWVASIFWRD